MEVAVELDGRLGNQLWMVAAGAALARQLQNSTPLRLYNVPDATLFAGCKVVTSTSHARFPTYKQSGAMIRPLEEGAAEAIVYKPWAIKALLTASSSSSSKPNEGGPTTAAARTVVALQGYRQNYKYLAADWTFLQAELIHPLQAREHIVLRQKQLPSLSNKIIVHVRLGDYLARKNLNIHPVPSDYYYVTAVQQAQRDTGLADVVIFCAPEDSGAVTARYIPLLRENVPGLRSVDLVFSLTPEALRLSPLQTMVYMSTGTTFVIANSSFSWWAAMMAANTLRTGFRRKRVYLPDVWFGLGYGRGLEDIKRQMDVPGLDAAKGVAEAGDTVGVSEEEETVVVFGKWTVCPTQHTVQLTRHLKSLSPTTTRHVMCTVAGSFLVGDCMQHVPDNIARDFTTAHLTEKGVRIICRIALGLVSPTAAHVLEQTINKNDTVSIYASESIDAMRLLLLSTPASVPPVQWIAFPANDSVAVRAEELVNDAWFLMQERQMGILPTTSFCCSDTGRIIYVRTSVLLASAFTNITNVAVYNFCTGCTSIV